MSKVVDLAAQINQRFGAEITSCTIALNEVTVELSKDHLLDVCRALRDEPRFQFSQLIDVCGVDYLEYGVPEWQTEATTTSGFSRAAMNNEEQPDSVWDKPRFAAVYHLLSVANNLRVRLKVFVEGDLLSVPSVINIWRSADWFEREAFDLFGLLFEGHPDLRRILTDYGFVGHPFRKDFPLIGNVEMRYDATQERCVYEPVSIEPRTLVPKVIREWSVTEGEVSG